MKVIRSTERGKGGYFKENIFSQNKGGEVLLRVYFSVVYLDRDPEQCSDAKRMMCIQ